MADRKNTVTPVSAVSIQPSCLVCDSTQRAPATLMRCSPSRSSRGISRRSRNTSTKVSRYSASGSTHSSGADATSVVTCVVNAVSRAEGTSASPTQPSRSAQVGAGCRVLDRRLCGRRRHAQGRCSLQHQQEYPADRRDQQQEADRPEAAQRLEAERGLQHERIGQERDQAAEVAGRIQEVGIVGMRMAGAREPGLQQRRVGGHRQERQADRHGEQADLPEVGLARRRLAPAARQPDRQAHQGDRAHAQVDDPVVCAGTLAIRKCA